MKRFILILAFLFPGIVQSQHIGNGEFHTTPAYNILRKASEELVGAIKRCPHHEFYSVKLSVSKERLISILSYDSIDKQPNLEKDNFNNESRQRERLHFTYNRSIQQIKALKGFFEEYKNSSPDSRDIIDLVKLKLAHEASQAVDYDEKGSRLFTAALFKHLRNENVIERLREKRGSVPADNDAILPRTASTNYKKLYRNDDGSYTIFQPRFKAPNGENLCLAADDPYGSQDEEGVCKLYGFRKYVPFSTSYEWTLYTRMVLINSNGKFGGYLYRDNYLTSILCEN